MKKSLLWIPTLLGAFGASACGVSQEGNMTVWSGIDGIRACRMPSPPDKKLASQPSTVPPPSAEMLAAAGTSPSQSLAPKAPGSEPPKPAMNVAEQMYRDEVAIYRLCEARANHWIDTRTYRCELERFAHGVDGENAWKGCLSSPARESDGRQ